MELQLQESILENLQTHPVEVVYEKVIKLLEQFFDIQYNE